MTPGNDVCGTRGKRSYGRRGFHSQAVEPLFKNMERMTLLPEISADGNVGLLIAVLKGVNVRTRTVLSSTNEEVVETIADCLPRRTLVTIRSEVAGVDKINFLGWAHRFVAEVSDLTVGGRKVLLLYDGYRSHMGYQVLKTLKEGGVMAYAIPAHTSSEPQQLDVGFFSPFKSHLNTMIFSLARSNGSMTYDAFDFFNFVTDSFNRSFTRDNIKSAFKRTGLWPCDPAADIRRPLIDGNNN